MKHMLGKIFHTGKFITGFVIFSVILLLMTVYPIINPGDPLKIISVGTFAAPGTYISVFDAVDSEMNTLKLDEAPDNRLNHILKPEDRVEMILWLEAAGVSLAGIGMKDSSALLELWERHYDESIRLEGMTKAKRNYYERLNADLNRMLSPSRKILARNEDDTGSLEEVREIQETDYVNINDVANVVTLPLGTDNFGRDVLKELAAAVRTSLLIGLLAGALATLIGLTLGLLAGFVGGITDDIIMFFTNIFTVIPSFILLILISYSVGQDQRGVLTVAMVIGFTGWVWTARAVRSQVISLRNRDHVNLSRLSGHSLIRIIIADILPYIASYVVMALILQISAAIRAEAQLSMLGLGPKTTEVPTLGLMMNWAMMYSAHLNGSWWAYFPVILTIALISFSLNLMNTGLDQVFNPTLRD